MLKQFDPPFFDQNSQSMLRVILPFELQTIIIVNFKPHRLLES
jgi:hypothetical protein